ALLKPLVRPAGVEERDILEEDGAQVSLTQDDDVVEALAAHAAEEPLAGCVHQRCANRSLQDADAGGFGDTVEFRAELGVAITDDEVRSSPERRELAKLLRRPAFIGFASDRDVDDLLGIHVNDDEGEQRAKPEVVDREKVAGPDGVVLQE